MIHFYGMTPNRLIYADDLTDNVFQSIKPICWKSISPDHGMIRQTMLMEKCCLSKNICLNNVDGYCLEQ